MVLFSYITIGGKTKIINLPNSFRIIPEFKSKLAINLGKCGAYIASGVWKAFMCHNLESNISDNPFTPNAVIHGAKYQWGHKRMRMEDIILKKKIRLTAE
ncbi:hypothetical protein [Elizabethkingia anophelis]|uniref:hypothetical protein n=1 Tax=Elizabethkingia anophelis TaxID=1117645 RepID=UPI0021A79BD2|nr:hypothetical protein [Elizabethkingia anophelis]